MKKKILSALVIFIVSVNSNVTLASSNKFSIERNRGWLWFEEKEKEEGVEERKARERKSSPKITEEMMIRAKDENEAFRRELDLRKQLMLRYPENLEYALVWKKKHNEMLERASKAAETFRLVNFLHPDIADELENPKNLYGRKTLREINEEKNKQDILLLREHVEVFVIRQDNCPYCVLLEKHLERFAGRYGFHVEALSSDGSNSKYFKTHHNLHLMRALQVSMKKELVMPTVIAVTNDSKHRFELARGAVSVADLEEKAVMMSRYLKKIGWMAKHEKSQKPEKKQTVEQELSNE